MEFAHNVRVLSLKLLGDSMGEGLSRVGDFVTMLQETESLNSIVVTSVMNWHEHLESRASRPAKARFPELCESLAAEKCSLQHTITIGSCRFIQSVFVAFVSNIPMLFAQVLQLIPCPALSLELVKCYQIHPLIPTEHPNARKTHKKPIA